MPGPATVEPGTSIAGFRVEAMLADDPGWCTQCLVTGADGEDAVLKLVPARLVHSHQHRRRFRRLVRRRAALEHPSFLPVVAAGDSEHGLFIALRRVNVPTLAELIPLGGIDPRASVRLLGQVADALEVADAHGIRHQELTPSGIQVDPHDGGRALLGDLGIARPELPTKEMELLAAPSYLTPEEIRDEPADLSTSVYSLACILYACLAGADPYAGMAHQAVVYAHVAEPPPRVTEENPELPPEIDAVLATGMAKLPAGRFARPWELIEAAAGALDAELPARVAVDPPPTPVADTTLAGAGTSVSGVLQGALTAAGAGGRAVLRALVQLATMLAAAVRAGVTAIGAGAARARTAIAPRLARLPAALAAAAARARTAIAPRLARLPAALAAAAARARTAIAPRLARLPAALAAAAARARTTIAPRLARVPAALAAAAARARTAIAPRLARLPAALAAAAARARTTIAPRLARVPAALAAAGGRARGAVGARVGQLLGALGALAVGVATRFRAVTAGGRRDRALPAADQPAAAPPPARARAHAAGRRAHAAGRRAHAAGRRAHAAGRRAGAARQRSAAALSAGGARLRAGAAGGGAAVGRRASTARASAARTATTLDLRARAARAVAAATALGRRAADRLRTAGASARRELRSARIGALRRLRAHPRAVTATAVALPVLVAAGAGFLVGNGGAPRHASGPSPATALAARAAAAQRAGLSDVGAALGRLDGQRVVLRHRIAVARTARGQASESQRMARAYESAVADLDALPAPRPLTAALSRAGRSYHRLASAALHHRRAAYARARRAVRRSEADASGLVRSLAAS